MNEIEKKEQIKKSLLASDLTEIKKLSDEGVDMSEFHIEGRTDILLETIVEKRFTPFKNLLKDGFCKNNKNFLYMHHVVRNNEIIYLEELLKYIDKEDINQLNEEKENALHIAIKNNVTDNIILTLSKNKVSWNSQNIHGQTPIHYLLRYRENIEKVIIDEITSKEVDMQITDELNISPNDILNSFKLDYDWSNKENNIYLQNKLKGK